MCGVVGYKGHAPDAPERLQACLDRLKHRGPDDGDLRCWAANSGGPVWLGHRRLSIIDLSAAGRQPLGNEDGSVQVVFNGEIYNFQELRPTLEAKGHRFRSHTDTEVIVHAYEEWGARCVDRFVGMFAFAIWDARTESLLLARDRLGIKPLYYRLAPDGSFGFASELKALCPLWPERPSLNVDAIAKYLAFLWIPDPLTPFHGYYRLPPGHLAEFRQGKLRLWAYWDLPVDSEKAHDFDATLESLDELLGDAVRLRLISDVPLGVYLSGGLDSSLITRRVLDHSTGTVVTFSIGSRTQDQRYRIAPEDIEYARRMAQFFGRRVEYHEIVVEPNVVELLPLIAWHLDDPIADPAAIPTYLIAKAAKERATVMLSGMGAEEVFGGYPRHAATYWTSRLPGIATSGLGAALRFVANQLRMRPGPWYGTVRDFKKLAQGFHGDPRRQYLAYRTYFSPQEITRLLGQPFTGDEIYREHLGFFDRVRELDLLDQLLYVDAKTFLPSLNLAYTDRASMAAEVEVRVPLLDHRIVELATRMPAHFKVRGMKQKYVLKQLGKRYLPREIVSRRKAGFSLPVRAWLDADLRSVMQGRLSAERLRQVGFFEPSEVARIVGDFQSGARDLGLALWSLLFFDYWWEQHIQGRGTPTLPPRR